VSRIVLSTLGSLGDLHPLIAIGLELRRRGHEVSFCVSETYRPRIISLGFAFEPLRPDATPENPAMSQLVREIMDPRKGAERLIRGLLVPALRATYDDLLRAIAKPRRADLLVCGELVYPAPLIAEKLGIPRASYITAPMSFFSKYDLPILPPAPQLAGVLRRMGRLGPSIGGAAINLVKFATRNWSEPIRTLRKELGLPPGKDPIYEGKFSPHLVLATFSQVMAKPQPDWPPATVLTGFPFYDGAPDENSVPPELTRFLEAGDPPIVFTLGSSAVCDPGRFYIESAQAAGLLNRRAVLLVGRNPPPQPLPEEVIAVPYVRFSELFPRATAVVHQGGIGTTGQTLRASRPMLVIPYNFDRPDNAARMVRLGVGRLISRAIYSAGRVARHLEKILGDPVYLKNATEIGKAVQRENGSLTACDAVQKLLG
jgi:rhamnosyltransferase subunit B